MIKFHKDLKAYAKHKKVGYCHTVTKKGMGKLKNLIEIPKGVKYLEIELGEIINVK